jgi:hypothetical protein
MKGPEETKAGEERHRKKKTKTKTGHPWAASPSGGPLSRHFRPIASCDPPSVRDLQGLLLAAVDNVIVLISGGGTMDKMLRKSRQLLPNGYYEDGNSYAPKAFCNFW